MNFIERSNLPVASKVPEIVKTLDEAGCLVLSAAPGAGKTTLVPPALLCAPFTAGKRIYLLEPRRVAARAAAQRIAALLGEKCGESCGYIVRGESCISAETRLFVVTEGVMLRKIQEDPLLEEVSTIIFDEFHERNCDGDLSLTFVWDVRKNLNPELNILVMSATLAAEKIQRFLDNAPLIEASGRQFPVEILYSETSADIFDPVPAAVKGVCRLYREYAGDMLVFLPGMREIEAAAEALQNILPDAAYILKLHGSLESKEQDKALAPTPENRRKIVLATNVAESSITIDGVTCVVDCGLEKHLRYDAASELPFLETVRISQASAIQRSGRAGRTAPGVALRLWTAFDERSMKAQSIPEILDAELTSLRLELAAWGAAPEALQWLDAPPDAAIKKAEMLLAELGALDNDKALTALGRQLVKLPVHPRLGMMLLRAKELKLAPLAAEIAAVLEERDRFNHADLSERISAMRRTPGRFFRQIQNRDQFLHLLHEKYQECSTELAGVLVGFAYPDWIGKSREKFGRSYLLAGGRGAQLPLDDEMVKHEFLAVARLEGSTRSDAAIRLAAPVSREELEEYFPERFAERYRVEFDMEKERALARKELCFGNIVLSSAPAEPPPGSLEKALVQAAVDRKIPLPPVEAKSAVYLLKRLCFASQQEPEKYPAWDMENFSTRLLEELPELISGVKTFRELKNLDWYSLLRTMATWEVFSELERDYPESFVSPAGSSHKIDYEQEQPTLSAKIQEFYGVKKHPSVGRKNFPLRVELLSPAGRPVQITTDLPGFWSGNWPLVQKEMKSRYPKHFWPDTPATEDPRFLKRK
ncbi:MAG: ATP-dependent helicase HrpB [Lentisphaeria bacterium]|nr:ATP-dependent helicase HrpB [Lentisphaeria bacterium]